MGHGSIYEEDEDNGSSFGDDSRGNSKDMKDSMTNKNQVAQEEQRKTAQPETRDKRSKWGKLIDICLQREDIFDMPKDQFNYLFDIIPVEQNSSQPTDLDKNKLSSDQAKVLQELNEFSSYIKRDINLEGRQLRRELDLHEKEIMVESSASDVD